MTDKTSRLLMTGVIIFACGLVASGYQYFTRESAAIREQKQTELKFISEARARDITRWRQVLLMEARRNSTGLVKMLANSLTAGTISEEDRQVLQKRLMDFKLYEDHKAVFLALPDGSIEVSTETDRRIPGPQLQSLVKRTVAAGEAVIGDLFRSARDGHIYLDTAAPILDNGGNPVAVLILRSDAEISLFPLLQTWPTPSPTAETLLVTRSGDDALLLNTLRHSETAPMTLKFPLSDKQVPAVQAVLGTTGTFEGNDYRGVPVLAQLTPVENSPWFIVAKVDRTEILADLYEEGLMILLIMLLTFLTVAVLTQAIFHSRKAKLQAELIHSERGRLEEENKFKALWEHMAAASCIDEIVYENGKAVDYRVLDINPAFERSMGIERSRAVGALASELYGTPIPYLDTYAEVAETGVSTSFEAFFPPLGRHLNVIASCPAKGRFSTVFTDMTERKQMEDALRNSEEQHRLIFEESDDALMTLRPPSWNFDSCNKTTLEMFRVRDEAEFTKLGPSSLSPDKQPDGRDSAETARSVIERTLVEGSSLFEWTHRRADGELFPAEVLLTRIERHGEVFLQATVRDISKRKAIEEALRVSEEKFAAIFRSSPDSFFLTTVPDGLIVEVNNAGCRFFGGEASEIIGQRTDDLGLWVDPADRERYMDQVRREGQVFDFETRFRIKSGEIADATISGEIIHLKSGPHFLSVIRDVRDRKRVERLQEKSARRVQALLDLLQMREASDQELIGFAVESLVKITDSELAFIGEINAQETTMTAHLWSAQAMAQCSVDGHPSLFDLATGGLWAEAVKRHQPLVANDYVRSDLPKKGTPAGHVKLKRFMGIPAVKDGRAVLMAGMANKFNEYDESDQTEVSLFLRGLLEILDRRKAEQSLIAINERLRTQESQQRAILDNIPDIAWLKDSECRFIAVNEPLGKTLGMSPLDVVGRTDFDFYPEELAKLYRADDLDVMASRTRKKVEEPYQGADGRVITIETIKTPMISEDGKVIGTAGIARDITERKQLESDREQFEIMARQQQKLESIGTLASGVAHEINNPLNVILNYGQLILDNPDSRERISDFATNIVKESDRVAVIVRNLLSFARQEKETHSPARMKDIVDKTLSLTSASLRKDHISISCEIPEDLPSVRCRSQQIQQVLMNLLTNARDALNARYPKADPDKSIRISAAPFERDGIDWVRLTVADNGIGISSEIAGKVFDPFFSTKQRNMGTGLGLSISYGIVREHHGELSFESEPGEGTRFYVDLRVNNGWTLNNATDNA